MVRLPTGSSEVASATSSSVEAPLAAASLAGGGRADPAVPAFVFTFGVLHLAAPIPRSLRDLFGGGGRGEVVGEVGASVAAASVAWTAVIFVTVVLLLLLDLLEEARVDKPACEVSQRRRPQIRLRISVGTRLRPFIYFNSG